MKIRSALAHAFLFTLVLSVQNAKADERIFPLGTITNTAGIGPEVEYGTCPCFRWTVRVDLVGGEYETRSFVISSDALFRYLQASNQRFQYTTQQTMQIGAIEALLKGAHIGLSFHGVTLGQDLDHGYTDILATGFDFLVNLFRTDSYRFDLKTGFDHEQLSVNMSPLIYRNLISESFRLKLGQRGGRFKSELKTELFVDPSRLTGPDIVGIRATGMVHAKIVETHGFSLGAAFAASYEHDPFRITYGLDPNDAVAGLTLDVGYEP